MEYANNPSRTVFIHEDITLPTPNPTKFWDSAHFHGNCANLAAIPCWWERIVGKHDCAICLPVHARIPDFTTWSGHVSTDALNTWLNRRYNNLGGEATNLNWWVLSKLWRRQPKPYSMQIPNCIDLQHQHIRQKWLTCATTQNNGKQMLSISLSLSLFITLHMILCICIGSLPQLYAPPTT